MRYKLEFLSNTGCECSTASGFSQFSVYEEFFGM